MRRNIIKKIIRTEAMDFDLGRTAIMNRFFELEGKTLTELTGIYNNLFD